MITTSDKFHEIANGSVRPLSADVAISWAKQRNSDTAWFTLGQSKLNGSDLLSFNEEQPIQLWDAYDYERYGDRIIELSISRSIAFPYGTQSAIADFTLDNHDGKLSFKNNENILPNRPTRLYLGFQGLTNLPEFVGLTEKIPTYDGLNDTKATFTAMDFLSSIGEMNLNQTLVMQDVRTDEALAEIFKQFGVGDEMYELDKGTNTIPYLCFESGKDAGNAIAELVQAENGKLWLDETGIIRFSPRTSDLGREPVAYFDKSNIISFKPSQQSDIVNRVKITSDVKAVQQLQPIYSNTNERGWEESADKDDYRIKPNANLIVWASTDDPIWSAIAPQLNGEATSSAFTAKDTHGNTVADGVTAKMEQFVDSLKLTFTNARDEQVSIDYIQIWGEPVKVIDTIKYDAYDDASVEKYGEHLLEITDNNCFGNYRNVDMFATNILQKRAEYSPNINMAVKGDPSLQLDDIVTLGYKYEGDYKITSIKHKLSSKGLTTELQIERYKTVQPFTLNVSQLNGEDLLS